VTGDLSGSLELPGAAYGWHEWPPLPPIPATAREDERHSLPGRVVYQAKPSRFPSPEHIAVRMFKPCIEFEPFKAKEPA
jgi:hypothetical protein